MTSSICTDEDSEIWLDINDAISIPTQSLEDILAEVYKKIFKIAFRKRKFRMKI